MNTRVFTTVEDARAYVLAGDASLTLEFPRFGTHFTYKVTPLQRPELRLLPISFSCFKFTPSLDVRRRIARERVPTSRNGIDYSNRQT